MTFENKTVNEPKNAASIISPRPPLKEEEPKINDQEKCGWGPDLEVLKERRRKQAAADSVTKCTKAPS